jgi:ABC-type methionine transport system ATPase subunit
MSTFSIRVKMTFPEALVRQPIVALLVRRFDVDTNIRRANVEEHSGWIIGELSGTATKVEESLAWLRNEGIEVDLLGDLLES